MISVGADPETFFTNEEGVHVSGHDIVPGTKSKPALYNQTVMQADGTACEFNTQPAVTAEEFSQQITQAIHDIEALAFAHGLSLSQDATAPFGVEYLKSLPRKAIELGCSPDVNAYTTKSNPKPSVRTPFRTAAGHVHIGAEGIGFKEACEITKALDVTLAIPSILFDEDVKRRELYGQAGAFRPKDYGLEYRVLSNRWIFSPTLVDWVFKTTVSTVERIKSGDLFHKILPETFIIDTINRSDLSQAKDSINKLGLETP